MQIKQNLNLKPYNSFGFALNASFFIELNELDDICAAFNFIAQRNLPFLIIGGGSNIIFTQDFDGVILKLNTKQITQVSRNQITVDGGVIWHDLVKWCLKRNLYGLENLALIPGSAGAAPMQNIGAYGAEFSDFCHSVTVLEIKSGKIYNLDAKNCAFSYRGSIFKQNLGKWLILKITLKLQDKFKPNLSYAPLKEHFANQQNITAQDVFDLVCQLRQTKLPEPNVLGNVGSFFHNPIIKAEQAIKLRQKYPNLPIYPQNNDLVKVAAGWLIEQCGFKGARIFDAGVHQKQALVLVNYGKATGADILALASFIQAKVFATFKIRLKIEPLII